MPAHATQHSPSRADFAQRIRAAVGRTVSAIFEIGDELLAAKAALAHGEFGKMVKRDLPFGERQAQKYMAIARCAALRNATPSSDLPANVALLYELSKLEPDELRPVLGEIRRHKDSDPAEIIPAVLLSKDIRRRLGRPHVTAQGVAGKVEEIAARAHSEPGQQMTEAPEPPAQTAPKSTPKPDLRVVSDASADHAPVEPPTFEPPTFEPVPDGELEFPDSAARVPQKVSTVQAKDAPPAQASPGLCALQEAWDRATAAEREQFMHWLRR